ncbi:hypothetical protein LOK49_LG01G04271 [Camellia lanceoleosa]|uniref:Uncharacterized protein n=1 Tax=Camellia lanceoleosa TaxID=1840588 RepID=A0ACC0IYN6_9ERIC|nr:hypothetical protein LOK49_LG01G04271 [Camellia lanceoleosa]
MSSDYSEPIIPDDAELDGDVSQGSTKRIRKLTSKVFIPDYNVYVAELVIPGSDLSQHIRSVICTAKIMYNHWFPVTVLCLFN